MFEEQGPDLHFCLYSGALCEEARWPWGLVRVAFVTSDRYVFEGISEEYHIYSPKTTRAT